ncbi:MAG: SRPBCC domain-containing protein [Ginsengibacter sp.]
MSNNLGFDFLVKKENKTITIKREFAAELPLVWDAYTKSEILDQWWAPKPWKASTKILNFREGGQWSYIMEGPNGEKIGAIGNYTNIQVQKKFTVQDFAFTDANGAINKDMPQSVWEVTFTDKGELTLVELKISYDDITQLEATIQTGFKEGFTLAMEGLDELLASLKKISLRPFLGAVLT